MMNYLQFQKNVTEWAKERKIIPNSPFMAQWIKLKEEFGELWNAVRKNDEEAILDAVGDTIVVLTILSKLIRNSQNDAIVDLPSWSLTRGMFADTPMNFLFRADAVISEMSIYVAGKTKSNGYVEFNEIPLEWFERKAERAINYLADFLEARGEHIYKALDKAWNEIKDRKGYLREDGIFVKEGD